MSGNENEYAYILLFFVLQIIHPLQDRMYNISKMIKVIVYLMNLHIFLMEQKGRTVDHDFYVVVGKQCRTENA